MDNNRLVSDNGGHKGEKYGDLETVPLLNQSGRKRLYLLLFGLIIAGYGWLLFPGFAGFCFIKSFTGIPCPSCGVTRSVEELLRGNFTDAFSFNPLGFPVLLIMTVVPVWIVKDLVTGSFSLYSFYQKTEKALTKWYVWIPFGVIISLIWIKNLMLT